MKVFEIIKKIREYKKISQETIAYRLDMNQSQYSRRENGQIPFTAIEIEEIAHIFQIRISEIYGEENVMSNKHNQDGSALGQHINLPEKLIDQYEKRIEEKELIISLLKEQIQILKRE